MNEFMSMDKQEFISRLLHSFEQNAPYLPTELAVLYRQIEHKLQTYSNQQLEAETSHVETETSAELAYVPDELRSLLYQAYFLMEDIAQHASENQYELLQAVNQLRGELGMATDLPL